MQKHQTTELTLGEETYVILPKAEYLRLKAREPREDTVDAIEYARTSLGKTLRAAREHAGLTQVELAAKLTKSQTLVGRSESGQMSVGSRYVAAVLKACGLPKDWKPTKRKA